MKVLIIIPAYNEEKNLPKLLSDIKENCPYYDVVVVNDCSTDRTKELCNRYNADVLDLPINLGIGGAVQTGYRYALYNNYDAAVQVDGDGQHNTKYIINLIEKLDEGFNLCIGSRFIVKQGFQSTATRRAGIKFFSVLIKFVTGQAVTDPTSGFRACDKKMIEYFAREYPRDYPEPETIVLARRNGFKVCETAVIMAEREQGKSSITKVKSIYYMIKVTMAILIASLSKGSGGKSR
ncbi:MAG TPA: glycosyltransferase family 2 protein [Clostridia bacterium]|nr:glycosyltransferase family 2 protein [Clostridia bacterium]